MVQRIVNFRAGERIIERIKLSDITISHNPRRPAPCLQDNLVNEGYEGTLIDVVHSTVLAGKGDEFVRLIEEYEPDIQELAASRRLEEIEPILLRSYRVKVGDEYVERYGIVCGERRYLAQAYNHAKFGDAASIGAVRRKMTVDEAEDLAYDENVKRKQLTPSELADGLRRKLERRQAVKPNYTIKDLAAEEFNVKEPTQSQYQHVRRRLAVAWLEADEKRKLDNKEINFTDAVAEGLRRKSEADGENEAPVEDATNVDDATPAAPIAARSKTRRRSRTIKELQEQFDISRNCDQSYLAALAWAMNMDVNEAIKESNERIEIAEAQAVAEEAA